MGNCVEFCTKRSFHDKLIFQSLYFNFIQTDSLSLNLLWFLIIIQYFLVYFSSQASFFLEGGRWPVGTGRIHRQQLPFWKEKKNILVWTDLTASGKSISLKNGRLSNAEFNTQNILKIVSWEIEVFLCVSGG